MPIVQEVNGTLINEKEALLQAKHAALLSEAQQGQLLSKEMGKLPPEKFVQAITDFFNSKIHLTPTPTSTPNLTPRG